MKIYGSNSIRLYMINLIPNNDYGEGVDRGWGVNVVGDHDEDYVYDALFDVPNK